VIWHLVYSPGGQMPDSFKRRCKNKRWGLLYKYEGFLFQDHLQRFEVVLLLPLHVRNSGRTTHVLTRVIAKQEVLKQPGFIQVQVLVVKNDNQ
jgi:hypothetical protein